MHLRLLFALGLVWGATTQAAPHGHGNCRQWIGTYVGRLGPDDTFTGLPTKLTLTVQQDGVLWSVEGNGVPELILGAGRYRCSASQVIGSFSGSHMGGKFTLMKRGASLAFVPSDVASPSDGGPNLLGFIPNHPIRMRKGR